MQQNFSYLFGSYECLNNIQNVPKLPIFSDIICDFLNDFSKELMKDTRYRAFQDLMAYAYWIRKSSVESMKKNYQHDLINRLGIGTIFHITPSNVPIQFLYSLTVSLLSGNPNVVKLSNKKFDQVSIVVDILNILSKKYSFIKNYIILLRYDHDDDKTTFLSSKCRIRIIWGSDNTIRQIKRIELPVRSRDMIFSDRFSLCLIDSNYYLSLNEDNKKDLANKYYIDTYYTDQNACSSPRVNVWFGDSEQSNKAKKEFYFKLNEKVMDSYEINEISVVDKYSKLVQFSCMNLGTYDADNSYNNIINVMNIKSLENFPFNMKGNSGLFYDYDITDINQLISAIREEWQTIAVCGINKEYLLNKIIERGVTGCDRIVDIGKTMNLSLVWDGLDFILQLSKIIEYK